MRPRLVEVRNFMGHVYEQVALPDQGMFFLSGESGAGKSSFIVDAVGYALFGNKATRYRRQEQLRHKDHQTEQMEVRVMFEFDDQTRLTVVRGLNAKGNPFSQCYQPDPKSPDQQLLLADTPSKVSREVRKRLGGMSPQQFYAAFVARQSEIAMLTNLVGAKRKELVHQLLGMRELERANEEVNRRRTQTRAQLKNLQGALGERTRDSEDARVESLTTQADSAHKRADDAEKLLSSLRTELAEAEGKLAPLQTADTARQRVAALTSSLQSRRTAAEELTKAAARHVEAAKLASQVQTLEADVVTLSESVEELRAQYQRSAEHAKLADERAGVHEHVGELRIAAGVTVPAMAGAGHGPADDEAPADSAPTAENLRTRQQVAQAELSRIRTERTERQAELEMLRETGQCTTCLRPLGEGHEHDRVLASVEDKLTEMADAEQATVRELSDIDAALPGVEERERRQAQAAKELVAGEARLQALDARLQELVDAGEVVEDLDALKLKGQSQRDALAAKRTELAAAQTSQANLDENAPAKLAEVQELIAAEEKQLAEAETAAGDITEGAVTDASQKAQELRGRVAAGEGQLPELHAQAKTADRDLAAAVKDREALADKLDRAEEVHQQLLRLEDLSTYLGGFQRKLAADIRPVLEEMASEMLYQVSGGKHVTMKLDDNYEIEVQTQEGSWLPAAGLSGGESIRVNLCLRLALTRLVSQRTGVPVRYLVLDEPLPSQDPGHVERIMQLLDSLRPFYPQIHLISHVGELRAAEQMDYIMSFEGEGSKRIALAYA